MTRIAGIVTYNPELLRLKENIEHVVCQVDMLLIYDNGSKNSNDIESIINDFPNIRLIKSNYNCGMATALNILCEHAINLGADWLLTLDQDSVITEDLLDNYDKWIKSLNNPNIASLTCQMDDISGTNVLASTEDGYIDFCITSGNYISLNVWKTIGKFDDRLFIDKVDTDYCYRVIKNGFSIYRIPYCGLHHEIGDHVSKHKFFNKTFYVMNHSPFRCYYIIRNQIYFARKYSKDLGKKKFRVERTAWTRILVYIFFETQKKDKLKAWLKGIYDGYTIKIYSEEEKKMNYNYDFFKKSMPDWKKKKDPFIAKIFHRPISFWFSALFVKLGLTPNQVSFISFIIAVITCLLFFSTDKTILIIAAILMNIWSITDSADGNMARALGGQPFGDFIDAISSYYMVGFMFVPMAYSVYMTGGIWCNAHNPLILIIGALASSCDTMTRLFFQKMKNNASEIKIKEMENNTHKIDTNEIVDRSQSIIGRLQIKIDSELSMGGWNLVAIFPCIIFNAMDLYIAFYFIYFGLTFCASIPYLIYKTGCLKK